MSERKIGPRHVALLALALVVLVGGGSWVYSRFFESAESKVRRALAEVRAAANDRNPRAVSNMLTQDFAVSWRGSSADKNDVHNAMVRLLMTEYRFGFQVRFVPEELDVEVAEDEKSATARF